MIHSPSHWLETLGIGYFQHIFSQKKGRTETMGMHNSEQYQIPEFDSFESFVLEWLAHKNVDELDFIFQTQSRFLVDEKGLLLPEYIGKLENMVESIDYIESSINRKLKIPHANRVERKGSYRDYYISEKNGWLI